MREIEDFVGWYESVLGVSYADTFDTTPVRADINTNTTILSGTMRTEDNMYDLTIHRMGSFVNLVVNVTDMEDASVSVELFSGEFTFENFRSALGRVLGNELISSRHGESLFITIFDIETDPFTIDSIINPPVRHA